MSAEFIQLSLVPLLIGTLASIACGPARQFPGVRRQSLIGDAVSHVALPGIVIAFLITGTVAAWPMLIGAAAMAIVAVVLIETIRRVGRIEPGAAMGVVFTALFAMGVLLLEQSDASSVHLDVEHALYGNLESLIWIAANDWTSLFDREALAELPPQLPRLAVVLLAVILFMAAAWKELVIGTFDPDFARSIGARPVVVSLTLLIMVAIAAVAAFDAVGSIIVIAMFICPPATARLMTNRLMPQVVWSVVFSAISAIAGYVIAGYGPIWLGAQSSVSAAGMIATVSGLLLFLATIFGPHRHRAGVPASS
ncbi:MAG: metal ABC transporter permease [Rhodomicrobium sp.]|nr:metal ABC transporter permease [Rhodomicrobium sp.]